MKTVVFSDGTTVIVVGLDKSDNPIDTDGTLFGSKSGRDIKDFNMYDFYPSEGESVIIEPQSHVTIA